ncbi:ribonuclease HII [Collinsella sp. AGMB00827]|uniref:Ribonuclease HII n=1 Tax=Collinsella ureilytica TaxID=2869515 RepID=A0ABS7ML05_9ACTN|nr:ribonuclease HII [Collinsella urealyticum]MBY4798045.1 ribonuclease HII [Collinsella urealyticum]
MANLSSSDTAAHIAAELASAQRDEARRLIELFCEDPRSQVQTALKRARRRLERDQAEHDRVRELYRYMHELGGHGLILGVDEVGRGSIAGPLTVCALSLPDEPIIWGIDDSKRLSPQKRQVLAAQILEVAQAVGICHIEPARIDVIGMAAALREAVLGAIADTGVEPDAVLIDGTPLQVHQREIDVVHGDARVASIAAASIVAKVTRDDLMVELDEIYPGYSFSASKGYASPDHIAAIGKLGLSPVHRVSFCGNFLKTESLF